MSLQLQDDVLKKIFWSLLAFIFILMLFYTPQYGITGDDVTQYNLINNSISQYINKSSSTPEVQTYTVKDLCSIYITVNDTMPYDPLKRDYDMQIVADKNVTAYN